ncbi:MAG: PEGA domain-containing protein [Candidatus Aminicenantales bacterium]
MKAKISALLVFCLCFYLTNCATLFKGTSEEVNFGSNPSGAEIWVDGKMMGRAPINFKLITKKTYVIEFKYGGQTKTINLNNHVGVGWVILDVLAGLIPIIVDAATGAWYSFDQKNVNVDFKSHGAFESSSQ